MSEAGKVLHLYVEVRPVAEEDRKVPGRGDDEAAHLMLQCPDILPHSQKISAHSSPNRSPDLSPVTQHHTAAGSHSLPSSTSLSRHSVSFQLQNPDPTASPTLFHQQEVLYDSFGQLLQVFSPGMTGSGTRPGQYGSQGCSCPPDLDPCQGRVLLSPSSTSSGRLTVPSTLTSTCRSYDVPGMEGEEGRTSVVTFSYIEKANVHRLGGRRTSMCLSQSDNPFNRLEGELLRGHLQKRLSDPLQYSGQPTQDDPYPNYPCSYGNQYAWGSPHPPRTTMDAVARDATYRALEEFGSPELKRRFAGHSTENCSPTLSRHHQPPNCPLWESSPVLPRITRTLPSKSQLLELDRGVRHSSVNGLPQSPASDHLCAHAGYSSQSVTPDSTLHNHGLPQSLQRPCEENESPRLSSKFHAPLSAGRPTDIQHEIPTGTFPSSCQPSSGYQTNENHQQSLNSNYNAHTTNASLNSADNKQYNNKSHVSGKDHYKLSRSTRGDRDVVNGRRSVSPSSNADVETLAVEATRLSTSFADRWTPSPAPSQTEALCSESPKMRGPYLIESQPYTALHGQSSPGPLQASEQTIWVKTDKPKPQTQPGHASPLLSQKGPSSPACPALPARMHRTPASHSPALDPQQQWSSSPSKDMSTLHSYQQPWYTGDYRSPGTGQRQYGHLFESPELFRRLLSSQNAAALPVSWTSRHQEWREAGPVQDGDKLSEDRHFTSRVWTPSKEEYHGKNRKVKRVKVSERGYQRQVAGLSEDQREEVQNHSGAAGTSSQSSSGVTGSMGDSSQLDINGSLSPETSSQSSHDTADTGSGIQVGWSGG